MPIKRWWVIFVAAALTVAAAICTLNLTIDPFGVFGDRIYDWYSFNMTKNPKAAKVSYLDANHGQYNAYILGPSSSSSFLPETLDKYTGLRWYNTFNYGADMAYTLELAQYLADSFEVRQFMLVLPYVCASKYNMPSKDATEWHAPQISGTPAAWLRFLFANPRYSFSKTGDYRSNSYLQESFDVFLPQSGVYDKSSRDAAPIGALADYTDFEDNYSLLYDLTEIENCMTAVQALKTLCDGLGIELTVVVPPLPGLHMAQYNESEISEFYARLGDITPFHDYARFVPDETRYYYDSSHFRNNVGNMILADIYGDKSAYIYTDGDELDHELTVLLYHHITSDGADDSTSIADFRGNMERIRNCGYTPVSLCDIDAYVYLGKPLPQKPLIIRFDDGYLSNYELALPILEEFGYKAVIFAIGVTVGRDTYKDTSEPITPHFTSEQAREMVAGGLIEVQSHTYDMHQVQRLDGENCRIGVLRRSGESEADYINALRADFTRSRDELESGTGSEVFALAYPYGQHEQLAEVILSQMGFRITFASEYGVNTLVKGLPQSLYCLKIQDISKLT